MGATLTPTPGVLNTSYINGSSATVFIGGIGVTPANIAATSMYAFVVVPGNASQPATGSVVVTDSQGNNYRLIKEISGPSEKNGVVSVLYLFVADGITFPSSGTNAANGGYLTVNATITATFNNTYSNCPILSGVFPIIGASNPSPDNITSGFWGSQPTLLYNTSQNNELVFLIMAEQIGTAPTSASPATTQFNFNASGIAASGYTYIAQYAGQNTFVLSGYSNSPTATAVYIIVPILSPSGSNTSTGKTGIPIGAPSPGPVQPGTVPGVLPNPVVLPQGPVINSVSTQPNTPIHVSRNTNQSGPSNNKTSITCGIANAKLIQKKILKGIPPANASYNIPTPEPAAGFFSILPVNGPDNINVAFPQSGSYGNQYFVTNEKGAIRNVSGLQFSLFKAANNNPSAQPSGSSNLVNEPMFNGTIHLLWVNFNNGSNNQVQQADIQTILNFMNIVTPIQLAYAQQWGPCGATVDQTIYNVTLSLSGTSFNDATLSGNPNEGESVPTGGGFVDIIAAQLGFQNGGPTAHSFVIICPPGMLNTDCNPANGYLGYHSASAQYDVPYIFVPLTTNGLTANDVADIYQIALSHEIAEHIVDAAADLNNPEVCDSCGPNCQMVIRNFFDTNNNYITSSAFFIVGSGPGFTYQSMTNSVSQPPYATTAANTCPSLPYGSCAYAPPGANNPTSPFSPLSIPGLTGILPQPPNIPLISNIPALFAFPTLPNPPTIPLAIGQAPVPGVTLPPLLPIPISAQNFSVVFPAGVNTVQVQPSTGVTPVPVIVLPQPGY